METISINGVAKVTTNKEGQLMFDFLPDDPQGQCLETKCSGGNGQLMRSGTFCFVGNKRRVRSNALLIGKAAHGRLSVTKDKAVQLTLKAFRSEGIDWQRAFVSEAVELMTCLMGEEQMSALLRELLVKTEGGAR